jgi:hypothetical protein
MSVFVLRRGLLLAALAVGLAAAPVALALAQAPVADPPKVEAPKLKSFPNAEAAADAMVDAIRNNDDAAMAAMLGDNWRELVPANGEDDEQLREKFLAGWAASHKIMVAEDNKATVQVGTTGWVMPVPIVKQDDGWRFDIEAGRKEILARRIGHDEIGAIQTLLAIVDGQREYAALDPMKNGVPTYARRLMSTAGKKDGLYWETAPGEPESPLGPLVARAQAEHQVKGEHTGYYGYHYRLLYRQGAAALHGTRDYVVKGKMIGGFGVLAWPVTYGETGVMTFIVNQRGEVLEQDLGPNTNKVAGEIASFNPDKSWEKADMTPP